MSRGLRLYRKKAILFKSVSSFVTKSVQLSQYFSASWGKRVKELRISFHRQVGFRKNETKQKQKHKLDYPKNNFSLVQTLLKKNRVFRGVSKVTSPITYLKPLGFFTNIH